MKPLLDHLPDLEGRLPPAAALALLLDVDGTISPIAPSPADARVDPSCKRALEALTGRVGLVAAISGRPAAVAAAIVGVEGMGYIGDHGLDELGGPARDTQEFQQALETAFERLRSQGAIPGVILEQDGPNGAVHYRLAPDPGEARAAVLEQVAQAIAGLPVRLVEGRMVVQLRPQDDPGKGAAVARLLARRPFQAALYLGDDTVDIAAFHALHAWALPGERWAAAIAVLSDETPGPLLQGADYTVGGVQEVGRFLNWLAERYRAP